MTAARAAALVVCVVAALTAATPAGATNECEGLRVCVSVRGPWVVVPAASSAPRAHVEYQLSCPRDYVVGGLDARSTVQSLDVTFLGTLGSPVNPGVSTSQSVVFVGLYAARSTLPPTFKPYIGCVPRVGRGGRVPTSVSAVRPGRPVTRRVKTVRVRPGVASVVQRCLAGETLLGGSHAFAFATRNPPSASVVASVSGEEEIRDDSVVVRVAGDAELAGVRATIQVHALCTRAR